VNTRCAHVHAPPTCSHLRPGPTCRRPARGQGGLFKHWVSRPLGSHSQSSRLFSRVSPASLHFGDLGAIPRFSSAAAGIPAADRDRTRTEVSSRHRHGVACNVTDGDFFPFVCFDRSTSTGGGKPRGGVSGSRRRRRSARWGRFQAPCGGGRTTRWGGSRLSVVEDNREVGRLQDLRGGGEPRVGGADGGSALQRIEGQCSSCRQALIAFLQAFSTQKTN
jgi:hypothetical protein